MAANILSLVRHNRYDEAKEILSQEKAACDAKDEFSNTLLAVACQNGLKRMAKLILRYSGLEALQARNIKGNTPLHFCYLFGYGGSYHLQSFVI
jgi:ankyrin repeat protein